jgi:putative ATP-binding cassette transporter
MSVKQIAIFFGLTAISASLFLAGSFLRKLLQIRWRRTLTEAVLDRWLAGKAYWHLRDRVDDGLDNPDQRIAEDCRIFVDKLTGEAIEVITNCVALVSYVAILWSLSTFPLSFTMGGAAIEIPRYMVWAAPLYVAIASGMTHWLGKPLTAINIEQQRREGDFRFALTHLRQNVEAVALMAGEPAERRTLSQRFEAVASNWRRLAGRELILGCFTRPYMQTVLRIPLFLALPAFLAGRVTFGGLMQIGSAFQNVVTTLSWFIFSYRDIVELAAASRRLGHFIGAAEAAIATRSGPLIRDMPQPALRIDDIRLSTAGARPLALLPSLRVDAGEIVWLRGPSGLGKSSLVKAIAGLWQDGNGRIERPADAYHMPQTPYLPLGALHEALTYPAPAEQFEAARYTAALEAVGLVGLSEIDALRWNVVRRALSGGERQRLGLARLHLHRPALAILDEATSALDSEAEQAVLGRLRAELPLTTFIVIAHRPPTGIGAFRVIDLDLPAAAAGPRRHVAAEC